MKSNDVNEVQMDKHLNEVERQQYQDYTGRVMTYMDENGRNTFPMKRVNQFGLQMWVFHRFALGCGG